MMNTMFIPTEMFPPRDVLISMLMAERYQMPPLQTLEFWLCVDESRCEIVTRTRGKLFGIYKRGRVDIYYTNKQLETVADDLLDGLADSYLAAQRAEQYR